MNKHPCQYEIENDHFKIDFEELSNYKVRYPDPEWDGEFYGKIILNTNEGWLFMKDNKDNKWTIHCCDEISFCFKDATYPDEFHTLICECGAEFPEQFGTLRKLAEWS